MTRTPPRTRVAAAAIAVGRRGLRDHDLVSFLASLISYVISLIISRINLSSIETGNAANDERG